MEEENGLPKQSSWGGEAGNDPGPFPNGKVINIHSKQRLRC